MSWQSLNSVPLQTKVLVMFANGHVEDAEFFMEDGERYYGLFDGEMLNSEPVAWIPCPEYTP